MRKNFYKVFICELLLVFIVSFSFFAATKTEIQTEVVSIDKHGNVNLAVKGSTFPSRGFSASDIVSVKVDNFKFIAPIVKSYSDVGNGEFLLRLKDDEVSLAINMENFAEKSGAKVGSKVLISMKEKRGYLTTYQMRSLKRDEDRSHFESDEVFANFRCVSAGKIAPNRLYRSTNPIEQDAHATYAACLMENAGVNLVVNLADKKEDISDRLNSSSYYKNLSDNGNVIYLNMGTSFTSESFIKKMKEGLKFIAKNPGKVYYIHGKEGKNRTGYVIALLEALNGASLDEITDDYMLSYENYYGVKKDSNQYNEFSKTVTFIFSSINDGKMPAEKNLQKTVEKYLVQTVGLTEEEVSALKRNLSN